MSLGKIDRIQSNLHPYPVMVRKSLDERDLRILKQKLNNEEVINFELYESLIPEFEDYLNCREINQIKYIVLQNNWNFEVDLERTIYISPDSFNDEKLKNSLYGFVTYLLLTDRIHGFGQDMVCMHKKEKKFDSYRLELQEVKNYHTKNGTLCNKKLLYEIDDCMQALPELFREENIIALHHKTRESVRKIKRNYYNRIHSELAKIKYLNNDIIELKGLESKSLDDLVRSKVIYAWGSSKGCIYVKLEKSEIDYSIVKKREWRDLTKIEAEDAEKKIPFAHKDYEFWKKYCMPKSNDKLPF